MELRANDYRPSSLLEGQQLTRAQVSSGAVMAVAVHGVPVLVVAVYAALTAAGLLALPEPEPPPVQNVIQARFLQRGERIDPRELPNRRVPILRTDTAAPAPSAHANPDAPPPTPQPERQVNAMTDALQRLSDDAQIFAEAEERRVQEGDPDGIEGGEREASEGDRYAGMLRNWAHRGWTAPTTIDRDVLRGLVCTVSISVAEDLHVSGFRVVRPSGNPDFDLSVTQQIQRLIDAQSTIPEPPPEVAFNYVGRDVGLRFSGRD